MSNLTLAKYMTTTAIACIVLGALSVFAEGQSITNTSGQVFDNVTIAEVRPDCLKVQHSGGLSYIPFRELPRSIQVKYNYDPEAEKQFLEDVATTRVKAQQRREEERILKSIRKTGINAMLSVIQITGDGMLASGYYTKEEEYTETKYAKVYRSNKRIPVETKKKTRTQRYELNKLFLLSSFSNLVDGDHFRCTIYPCGRYQYTTVLGGISTVERYATTPEEALQLLRQGR